VLKDEGIVKYYVRNSYMAFGMLFGIWGIVKLYSLTSKFAYVYEDYLDWVIFQQVKRGREPS